MSAYPTFSAGAILPAATLNIITANLKAFCQVRHASPQSISNGAAANLLFSTEDLDPLAWHSTVSNTERIIPTIAGWYQGVLNVEFGTDADYTAVAIAIYKNAAPVTDARNAVFANMPSGSNPSLSLTSGAVQLNGTTDYMSSIAFQTNTSAAANTANGSLSVRLIYPT